jgi:hypothetical protein
VRQDVEEEDNNTGDPDPRLLSVFASQFLTTTTKKLKVKKIRKSL